MFGALSGFFNFYLLGLSKLVPYVYTPLVMVFAAGLLWTIGAWIGPETRDLEFTASALDMVERPEPEPAGGWRSEPS